MAPELGTPVSLTSLEVLHKSGKVKPGSFIVLFDQEGGGIPYGPIRQVISIEPEGSFIVSAIGFDGETGQFFRIDQSVGSNPLYGVPIRKNVLRVLSEESAKMLLINKAVGQGFQGSVVNAIKSEIPPYTPPSKTS